MRKILITLLIPTLIFSQTSKDRGQLQKALDEINNLNSVLWNQQRMIDSLQAKQKNLDEDIDKDGVSDYFDRCLDTPEGARVDGSGCALDIDLDGFIDLYDNCVTVPGNSVDQGCPAPPLVFGDELTIEFGYQSSELDKNAKELLNYASNAIDEYGVNKNYLIVGYSTDNKHPKRDLKLAQARAEAVYQYMIGIKPKFTKQLDYFALGESDIQFPECLNTEYCKKLNEDWKNRANNVVQFKVVHDDTVKLESENIMDKTDE